MIDETDQVPGKRRRLMARGQRTDDGGDCTLAVIQQTGGGAGAIHGLGAPGVRPSRADLVALAEKILERAT